MSFAELINSSSEISNYYNSLPVYIRQKIFSNSHLITSYESLKKYAEELLKTNY